MNMLPNPKNTDETRNLILAMVVCAAILIGFETFIRPQLAPPQPVEAETAESVNPNAEPGAPKVEATGTSIAATTPLEAVKPKPHTAQTFPINSKQYHGSISDRGGRIAELTLPNYTKSLENPDPVKLFRSKADEFGIRQFFDAGWLGSNLNAPDAATEWQAVNPQAELEIGKPLQLTWQNETGQIFTRTFEIAEDTYTITMTDTVQNNATVPVTLAHYAQIHRSGEQENKQHSSWYNFFGPVGMVGDERVQVDYKDVRKNDVIQQGLHGWWGITTQYFMAALVPLGEQRNTFTFKYSKAGGQPFTTAVVQSEAAQIPPGGSQTRSVMLYAGPKKLRALKNAGHNLNHAVYYGWFDVISRPLFVVTQWLHDAVGNWGLAIILLTIGLKILLFPLASKSYAAMAKMKKLQPKMDALKERMGDDREKFTMEMLKLYKEEGVNPASGCWPMLLQIPIFFAMYKMILVSFEFRHAEFVGFWIHDLSAMDPYFILPLLMGASMWLQMRLSPPAADPVQQQVMQWMPVVFTVLFLWFPSGLVLYWLTNNVFSVAQQYWMMRRYN